MSHLTEIERSDHDELIFPSDYGADGYMRISWDFDEPEYRWVWIEDGYKPRGFGRIKMALKALLGREFSHNEVTLSEESVRSLYDYLATRMPIAVNVEHYDTNAPIPPRDQEQQAR